ncbi:MAG: hypothetical protein WDM85_09890 [Caulobacteraceae bacterium]
MGDEIADEQALHRNPARVEHWLAARHQVGAGVGPRRVAITGDQPADGHPGAGLNSGRTASNSAPPTFSK